MSFIATVAGLYAQPFNKLKQQDDEDTYYVVEENGNYST